MCVCVPRGTEESARLANRCFWRSLEPDTLCLHSPDPFPSLLHPTGRLFSIPRFTCPLGSSWVWPTETLTGATVRWQQAFLYMAPRPTMSLHLWALFSCSSLQVLRNTPYPCSSVWVLSHFSCIQFFETLWTVTHQAPLSIGFSRQEYWSCHALFQGIFPTQGSNWHL